MLLESDRAGETSRQPGWVMVAGGFHQQGGMDKANAAVARYLAERGIAVHLVTHRVDRHLARLSRVRISLVPRPFRSFALGERLLDLAGRAVARRATRANPGTRVVVNGGNCRWPDVNWVHAVHHAWPPVDRGAPAWFRLKNRLTKRSARRREARIVPSARVVIANSERTRSDLITHLGIDAARVRTIYLGADDDARPGSAEERRAARARLGCPNDATIVAFVGPLGRDRNKGFDTLWTAWQRFAASQPSVHLVAAGAGAAEWRAASASAAWASRVRFLGFTDTVGDVLAAADLLVSPVRYEAYGLNVHEALCRGVPVLVSRTAGIAERFPASLADMILADPEDPAELLAALNRWMAARNVWRERMGPFGLSLRNFTWKDMAARFVAEVRGSVPEAVAP